MRRRPSWQGTMDAVAAAKRREQERMATASDLGMMVVNPALPDEVRKSAFAVLSWMSAACADKSVTDDAEKQR